ncbi:hypothetical protein FAUST_4216 [Fusarium austroamericanum]|uniref:aldehyde dehydrogenase (NAD(+)) n=1 Tax=Fusarium austroamericanum TaxID=282268 RepID=A0AAN6C3H7_FUSAU|nr:hypothetical protein FAUST_4216 [Fusarium austroamericanum]
MLIPYSKSNVPRQQFINNEFIDVAGSQRFSLFNPKDGSLVADDLPIAGTADVDVAVKCAEDAFKTWRTTQPANRRRMMLRLADLIEEHADILGELGRCTIGTSPSIAKLEISSAVDGLRYYAGWIDKFTGEAIPQHDGFLKIVQHEPLGVTAGITPWNGPLIPIGMKAAPALATGNCFILKPSEKAPFSSLALGPLIKEAGFTPGVFQVLLGDGSTGALLASHMRIRKITFTGSSATGKKIQEMAAKSNLKRVTLELGGKSPAVVFDDCDIDNAVKWLVQGITINTGQVCIASSRLYIQEGIYDKFVDEYAKAMKDAASAIGDPDDPATGLGPLADETQFERVMSFIQKGVDGQGSLLVGGSRVGEKVRHPDNFPCRVLTIFQGFFVQPTAFTDVDAKSDIYKQEIFGPVAVLGKFANEDEVIALSNDSEFGLMAGVFTRDINKAFRVASAFETGTVGVNCMSLNFITAPFGGSKESGVGREGGRYGLEAFTETKTVMVNLTY